MNMCPMSYLVITNRNAKKFNQLYFRQLCLNVKVIASNCGFTLTRQRACHNTHVITRMP